MERFTGSGTLSLRAIVRASSVTFNEDGDFAPDDDVYAGTKYEAVFTDKSEQHVDYRETTEDELREPPPHQAEDAIDATITVRHLPTPETTPECDLERDSRHPDRPNDRKTDQANHSDDAATTDGESVFFDAEDEMPIAEDAPVPADSPLAPYR